MTDPIALRNRFAMVKGAWDEHLRGTPFPSLGDGTAEQKIERLELALTGVEGRSPLYRTDEHGTVELISDGARLWVETARRASAQPST